MSSKTYVCKLCEGVGQVAVGFDIDSAGEPGIEPCPLCVGKGWPPTFVVSRGEEPIVQVNAPVEEKKEGK